MAASLPIWIHDEVTTQLELGNSWLQEKNRAKANFARPSTSVDKKWAGIYHDNGSCIDVVGPIFLDRIRAEVLVLKVRYYCYTTALL